MKKLQTILHSYQKLAMVLIPVFFAESSQAGNTGSQNEKSIEYSFFKEDNINFSIDDQVYPGIAKGEVHIYSKLLQRNVLENSADFEPIRQIDAAMMQVINSNSPYNVVAAAKQSYGLQNVSIEDYGTDDALYHDPDFVKMAVRQEIIFDAGPAIDKSLHPYNWLNVQKINRDYKALLWLARQFIVDDSIQHILALVRHQKYFPPQNGEFDANWALFEALAKTSGLQNPSMVALTFTNEFFSLGSDGTVESVDANNPHGIAKGILSITSYYPRDKNMLVVTHQVCLGKIKAGIATSDFFLGQLGKHARGSYVGPTVEGVKGQNQYFAQKKSKLKS